MGGPQGASITRSQGVGVHGWPRGSTQGGSIQHLRCSTPTWTVEGCDSAGARELGKRQRDEAVQRHLNRQWVDAPWCKCASNREPWNLE